ncbi:hypothetical protein DFP72DRAFT_846849 [Ephemerocybe angulata]|uniref:Uncharacterized protein n=1 Tax=Ephemerocybe angulata TaxID=980116 RepID=A0A8H6HZE2_9AGAR|nr:hypothetical protein DFP72DRAFT_846849 [Tulosesus angulatus]
MYNINSFSQVTQNDGVLDSISSTLAYLPILACGQFSLATITAGFRAQRLRILRHLRIRETPSAKPEVTIPHSRIKVQDWTLNLGIIHSLHAHFHRDTRMRLSEDDSDPVLVDVRRSGERKAHDDYELGV